MESDRSVTSIRLASMSERVVEKRQSKWVSEKMVSTTSLITTTSLPSQSLTLLDKDKSRPKPELSRYSKPERSTMTTSGADAIM